MRESVIKCELGVGWWWSPAALTSPGSRRPGDTSSRMVTPEPPSPPSVLTDRSCQDNLISAANNSSPGGIVRPWARLCWKLGPSSAPGPLMPVRAGVRPSEAGQLSLLAAGTWDMVHKTPIWACSTHNDEGWWGSAPEHPCRRPPSITGEAGEQLLRGTAAGRDWVRWEPTVGCGLREHRPGRESSVEVGRVGQPHRVYHIHTIRHICTCELLVCFIGLIMCLFLFISPIYFI